MLLLLLVQRHISFFRCARELAETYAGLDQRVMFYLVTDSQHLKEDAQKVLGTELITTDFAPRHVHRQKKGHVDGVMSAVVEDYILAKADMLVATQVSFGKSGVFEEKSSLLESLTSVVSPAQDSGFVRVSLVLIPWKLSMTPC